MGFFATFWSWLDAQLTGYIGDNTARVATLLEPAVVMVATLYVMMWGYLQLTGRVDEPWSTGLKRIVMLAVVLGCGLRLWLYNSVIVSTFYDAPAQFAAAVTGARDPVSAVDAIWERGGAVAELVRNAGSGFGSVGYELAGFVVWGLVGVLCVYTMFLMALSSVALSVLLALGPLFIVMLLFDGTRRLFDAWLAQLTNYALVIVLTVMIAALLLRIVESFAEQTAALGAQLRMVDTLNMVLLCALVFLLMRQVLPIAAGLSAGVSLSSFGSVSGSMRSAVGWGVRGGTLAGRNLRHGWSKVMEGVRGRALPVTPES